MQLEAHTPNPETQGSLCPQGMRPCVPGFLVLNDDARARGRATWLRCTAQPCCLRVGPSNLLGMRAARSSLSISPEQVARVLLDERWLQLPAGAQATMVHAALKLAVRFPNIVDREAARRAAAAAAAAAAATPKDEEGAAEEADRDKVGGGDNGRYDVRTRAGCGWLMRL